MIIYFSGCTSVKIMIIYQSNTTSNFLYLKKNKDRIKVEKKSRSKQTKICFVKKQKFKIFNELFISTSCCLHFLLRDIVPASSLAPSLSFCLRFIYAFFTWDCPSCHNLQPSPKEESRTMIISHTHH